MYRVRFDQIRHEYSFASTGLPSLSFTPALCFSASSISVVGALLSMVLYSSVNAFHASGFSISLSSWYTGHSFCPAMAGMAAYQFAAPPRKMSMAMLRPTMYPTDRSAGLRLEPP
jgi:hypothetical protein